MPIILNILTGSSMEVRLPKPSRAGGYIIFHTAGLSLRMLTVSAQPWGIPLPAGVPRPLRAVLLQNGTMSSPVVNSYGRVLTILENRRPIIREILISGR